MRRLLSLFFLTSFLGGLGGMLGSMLGHSAGKAGLFIGAILGGLVGAVSGCALARRRAWIQADRFSRTALGAAAGFLFAAFIASRTLSTPVGPILSAALIGIGAVAGAGRRDA